MIDIKGVEVLEVVSSNLPSLKWFLLILLLILILCAGVGTFSGWLSNMTGAREGAIMGAIFSLVIIIPLAFIYIIESHDKPEQPQYKVFVTKEVNMEEFLEEYIIIEQEGKILTIEKISE